MNSRIVRQEAQERVEIDDYNQIVGNFLVRYGDPSFDQFAATVHLIEGCNHSIHEVAELLKQNFPASSCIQVQSQEWLDEMYIDLEWEEMEYQWDDHDREFQKRVIDTLEMLSIS